MHPALPEHPQHALWKRDFTGACSLFGVVFQPRYTIEDVYRFIDSLALFGIGAELGRLREPGDRHHRQHHPHRRHRRFRRPDGAHPYRAGGPGGPDRRPRAGPRPALAQAEAQPPLRHRPAPLLAGDLLLQREAGFGDRAAPPPAGRPGSRGTPGRSPRRGHASSVSASSRRPSPLPRSAASRMNQRRCAVPAGSPASPPSSAIEPRTAPSSARPRHDARKRSRAGSSRPRNSPSSRATLASNTAPKPWLAA